ncbi:MAG TPA: hypothetical protein VFD19_02975 [Clostridia bacterium]|nr:hypothetical protein [Clostridia bacterium]
MTDQMKPTDGDRAIVDPVNTTNVSTEPATLQNDPAFAEPGTPVQVYPGMEPHAAAPAYQPPAPFVLEKPKKIFKGIPGITGFGFTSALLSLFFLSFYKEAFSNYLLYEGAQEIVLRYYYYATLVWGGMSALFALFGLILTPFGSRLSKRRGTEGRALGVAGVLISLVAIILMAAVTVSHWLLYSHLFPN